MKWLVLLQAVSLCSLLGCSVNDDPLFSPVNPSASLDRVQCSSSDPDDGDVGSGSGAEDPSRGDSGADDANAPHAGPYFGDHALPVESGGRSKEEIILADNCRKLASAVEEFAGRAGRYPEDVDADRTPDGATVVDLMPRDGHLPNPYGGRVPAVPVNRSAVLPGEIGYAVVHAEHDWAPGTEAGYVITARTLRAGFVAYSNLGYPGPELVVLSHARTVQIAVERFAAENDGIYPGDVAADSAPSGRTVVDLLPEGCYLENPMTLALTEPVDGAAANPGEIGLVPVVRNGVNRGYVITGVGREAGGAIIVIERRPRGSREESREE